MDIQRGGCCNCGNGGHTVDVSIPVTLDSLKGFGFVELGDVYLVLVYVHRCLCSFRDDFDCRNLDCSRALR